MGFTESRVPEDCQTGGSQFSLFSACPCFYPQAPAKWPCCPSPTSKQSPGAFQPMALTTQNIPRAWSPWPALQFPFLGARAKPRTARVLIFMVGPAEGPWNPAWVLPSPLRPRASQVLDFTPHTPYPTRKAHWPGPSSAQSHGCLGPQVPGRHLQSLQCQQLGQSPIEMVFCHLHNSGARTVPSEGMADLGGDLPISGFMPGLPIKPGLFTMPGRERCCTGLPMLFPVLLWVFYLKGKEITETQPGIEWAEKGKVGKKCFCIRLVSVGRKRVPLPVAWLLLYPGRGGLWDTTLQTQGNGCSLRKWSFD